MTRPSRHGSHHAPIIHLSHCHCAMIHSTDTVTLSKTTCCDVCATSWTRARRSIGGKPQPNRRVGPGMFDRLCMSMFLAFSCCLGQFPRRRSLRLMWWLSRVTCSPCQCRGQAQQRSSGRSWSGLRHSHHHGTRSAILRLHRLYLGTASDERAIERKGRAGQSLCKLDMEGIAICRR